MAQGVLPYKYEKEKTTSGMTALAGLPVYLEADEGFCRILHRIELKGLPRKDRRETESRWRKEKHRSVPLTGYKPFLHTPIRSHTQLASVLYHPHTSTTVAICAKRSLIRTLAYGSPRIAGVKVFVLTLIQHLL